MAIVSTTRYRQLLACRDLLGLLLNDNQINDSLPLGYIEERFEERLRATGLLIEEDSL
jgi:hypothetical protein